MLAHSMSRLRHAARSAVRPSGSHPARCSIYPILAELLLQLLAATRATILDRLPLNDAATDRLTEQTVSPPIYSASYPAWFFSPEAIHGTADSERISPGSRI